jgi:hypothetical protein
LRKVLSHFLKLSVLLLTFLVFSSCGDIPDEALNNEGSSVLVNGTGRAATASVNSSQPPAVLPPVVTEEAVVKAGGAVLLGMVDPKTEETDVWFEWGNDPVLVEGGQKKREAARACRHPDDKLRTDRTAEGRQLLLPHRGLKPFGDKRGKGENLYLALEHGHPRNAFPV